MTDSHDSSAPGLEQAAKRLDQALAKLESRFDSLLQTGAGGETQAPDAELAEAAAHASDAIARAIAEVKGAIQEAESAGEAHDGQG